MFVPGKPSQPSLILASNTEAYLSEHLLGASLLGRLLALPKKHKSTLERANTSAYTGLLIRYEEKSLTTLASGGNVIKLLSSLTNVQK